MYFKSLRFFVISYAGPVPVQMFISTSRKPAWKIAEIMISWCLSEEHKKKRCWNYMWDVVPMLGNVLYYIRNVFIFWVLHCGSSSLTFHFLTCLLLLRRNDSAAFSISAAADLWASFLFYYHIFYSLLIPKTVWWERRESAHFTNAKLDCCGNWLTCYDICTG